MSFLEEPQKNKIRKICDELGAILQKHELTFIEADLIILTMQQISATKQIEAIILNSQLNKNPPTGTYN